MRFLKRKPRVHYHANGPTNRRWRIGPVSRALVPGYGWCYRCKTTWTFVEGHSTNYGSNGRGCFPLCEQCWQELETPEARLPYYLALWHRWCEDIETAERARELEQDWRDIEAAVLAEESS